MRVFCGNKGVAASPLPLGVRGKMGWVSGLTHPNGQSWLKEGRGGGEQSSQEKGKWEAFGVVVGDKAGIPGLL